jgi:hypothetical protein
MPEHAVRSDRRPESKEWNMAKSDLAKLAADVRRQGFDKSYVMTDAEGDKSVKVGCSQCEALVISGTPCHETGCPNTVRT